VDGVDPRVERFERSLDHHHPLAGGERVAVLVGGVGTADTEYELVHLVDDVLDDPQVAVVERLEATDENTAGGVH